MEPKSMIFCDKCFTTALPDGAEELTIGILGPVACAGCGSLTNTVAGGHIVSRNVGQKIHFALLEKAAREFGVPITGVRPSVNPTPARASDPQTSHEGAAAIEPTIAARRAFALQWVQELPGHTAAELEELAGVRDGVIRKRLKELQRLGKAQPGPARLCTVTGNKARPWLPA